VIRIPLSFYRERPSNVVIDTIVIHSIYHPEFTCNRRYSIFECAKLLEQQEVSIHYLIGTQGEIAWCVDEKFRARHAGESMLPLPDDRRVGVNDFSIGIELCGDCSDITYEYPEIQYRALSRLIVYIMARNKIKYILGHNDIAPERKIDPGANFNWKLLEQLIGGFLYPLEAVVL
jgi:AmpD protein